MEQGKKEGLARDLINEINRCTDKKHLVLYGADLTGLMVYDMLKQYPDLQVVCFVDKQTRKKPIFPPNADGKSIYHPEQVELDEDTQAVILCAQPLWYGQMIQTIRGKYKKIEIVELLKNASLKEKILEMNHSKKRRADEYREIKVVIESQPRSGTNFITFSLLKALNGTFAATFRYDLNYIQHQIYGEVFYCDTPGPLVVYTHFFEPVSHHVTNRYPIVYPFRYILDCYHSWGKLDFYRKKADDSAYFLTAQSEEWKRLKSFIPLNRYWLDMIREHNYLRYEDWFLNKKLNMDKLRKAVPGIEDSFFSVAENKNRLYYQGNYREKMDCEVFDCLKQSFEDSIRFFWPEKSNDTY